MPDGFLNMREGTFTKENNNICNLPKLATIELHRSNETGCYYLNFIEHFSKWNEGRWQDQEIPEEVVRMLLCFCYPEHIIEIYRMNFAKEKDNDTGF